MIKNIFFKIINLIDWQLRKKNFDDIPNIDTANVLNSLEKNSYFFYKNFLNFNEINKIRKKLQQYSKTQALSEDNTIYYRSRTSVSIDQNYIKVYVENFIVQNVMKKFFRRPVKLEKCTYELKKGIKEKKNILGEHYYHIDRGYGVLKFCLFLKDIDIQNGPFCIVPGSHKWSANIRNFCYKLFHFIIEGKNDKIPHSKIYNYVNTKIEKKLVGKAGDLLIVNTGAFHRATSMKVNATREVFWIYTKFPSPLSLLKKKLINLCQNLKLV